MDEAFASYLQAVADSAEDLHSVMVLQHGKVLEEKFFVPDTAHILNSVSKTFTSTAVGFAISEGLLHLDDKIVDLSGIVVMRQVGGRKQAAVFDLRQVRKGNIEDPQLYGDDVIVVEQSGSKTAFRRFIESVPALGIFAWF